jgi:primosomal protein N' (replication factor Y)
VEAGAQRKGAKIVVGTRSAVFAPVQNLGLIVMDEEQESTYKSESSPRYHAREIAKFRVHYNNALLPALLRDAVGRVVLHGAKRQVPLPRAFEPLRRRAGAYVRLVDMNEEDLYRGKPMISMALARAISENLAQGRQSIVAAQPPRLPHVRGVQKLQNGRHACPNCSISMTYHAANNRLMCHYCGHSEPANVRCAACGA